MKKQKIADIYPEDTYNYEYYRWLLPIDTRTLAVVYDQDKESFINGYRGDIVGQTEELCPTIMPNAQAQYSMYLSIEFIQNFAKSIVQRYPPYQEVKLNATWVRTDTFQFRLLDLEYVLAGFAENYGKFYQNNVTFSCAAKDIINGFISDGKLIEVVLWKCDGLLWTTNTTT